MLFNEHSTLRSSEVTSSLSGLSILPETKYVSVQATYTLVRLQYRKKEQTEIFVFDFRDELFFGLATVLLFFVNPRLFGF